MKINWPTTNPQPINEYQHDGLCSLLFAKLFPNALGDPTKKSRLIEVSETIGFKHLLKNATRNSKNEFYYPFSEHPRFKFWAYDRLRRHRGIDQCNVYLKKNPQDATLTIGELKNFCGSSESDSLMKRMCSYSAKITGSDSFWFRRRQELEATFEQKEPATVFFTFSYADNHWNDLHKLMPGKN